MGCFNEDDIPRLKKCVEAYLAKSGGRDWLGMWYEDAVQDSIKALLEHHKRNHNAPVNETPEAYVRGVAHNIIFHAKRNSVGGPVVISLESVQDAHEDKPWDVSVISDPNFRQDHNQLSGVVVNSVLDQFNPEDQRLLLMHFQKKMTVRDIAFELGVSVGKAQKDMVNVKIKLNKLLVKLGKKDGLHKLPKSVR
ncbi:sigma-70 family RNA polymerase sigma factor [Thermodesulfobacteriota bacterium]